MVSKEGQELSHEPFTAEVGWSMLFGVFIACIIPVYTFYILRRKLGAFDSGAIAAAYGSVTAVTFVTAISNLEAQQMSIHGHIHGRYHGIDGKSVNHRRVVIDIYSESRIKGQNQKEESG